MDFLPAWLNPWDVLIAFALVGGAALGFVRGLVRMVLNLVALYVAVVLAMTFYAGGGSWIGTMSGLPPSISEALTFLFILFLAAAVLTFVLNRTYQDTELPGVKQIDQLGGMVVGFFVTSIWVGLVLLAITFFLRAETFWGEDLLQAMIAYYRASNLIPVFYSFMPIALATLRPWMPRGLPPTIFTFRL
jgi:uncharacterized membrane protein required for colicin V production